MHPGQEGQRDKVYGRLTWRGVEDPRIKQIRKPRKREWCVLDDEAFWLDEKHVSCPDLQEVTCLFVRQCMRCFLVFLELFVSLQDWAWMKKEHELLERRKHLRQLLGMEEEGTTHGKV